MEHSFSCPPNGKFPGASTEHLLKTVPFFRRTECSKRKFVLNLLKPIFDISFRLLHRFIIFFWRNWFLQMVNTTGQEKLPVLNFSHHSPKPTDFLNIIMSTIILLLITFSHRFMFYWFVSLCSWYASHVGYPWGLVCTFLLARTV